MARAVLILMPSDAVNHPKHYGQGEIECIDAIESCLGEMFEGYLHGNALKYLWRWKYKGKEEDLAKCMWYLNRLQEWRKSHGT